MGELCLRAKHIRVFLFEIKKGSINFYLNIPEMPVVDDWPSYNESLVMHGEILLNLDLLQSWGEELEEMNRCKEGGRYRYPHSLIELRALLKAFFRLPNCQLEGLTHPLSRWEPWLRAPDYMTT